MRRKHLPAVLLLALLSAGAVTETDVRTREAILSRLNGQVSLRIEELVLDVNDGVVQMGGSVASLAELERLERIVSGIPGVVRLTSEIRVRPLDRPEGTVADEVRRELERRPRFRRFQIEVSVAGNTVTLSGLVDRGIDRFDAGVAASRVEGVARVVNTIQIAAAADIDPERIRAQVMSTLRNPFRFNVVRDLEVLVEGSQVTLRGVVTKEPRRRAAERLAMSVMGVESVVNEIDLELE